MIGVVGESGLAQAVAEDLAAAGEPATASTAEATDSSEFELVVALGEAALAGIAAAEPDVPILPTEPKPDSEAVDVAAIASRIEAYRNGEAGTRTDPLLAVAANGEPVGRSYLDVMLVRSEPGRISEYSWSAGGDHGRFRADGVVLATPRGSHGYANAAGGPRLDLDSDVVAVVPVAAFGLGASAWVHDPAAGIDLRVERDTGAVSLLIDGQERRQFSGRSTVTVQRKGQVETIQPS